ncbi:gamma-glutamylcyclotransferase [Aquincola sp. S2]|uniref:glutathione-specific gamma-glutamylcyclotransferase n=1 Tax=Pseudaquabacterium terrae TaxID=2732868 RepID=A0ABX2ESR8_9BURK|nr:gamma-glutamylcyclotransferase [Aquabacterium terrae]NRF71648.1 gamma-glutamylcyclotransferase [Aquabacterium terrae]
MSTLVLTRERLRETPLDTLFAGLPPGYRIRSEAELRSSLEGVLEAHDRGTDVHVFGYGSLMWNPAFEFSDAARARVLGWHRRFCLRLVIARGTPSVPGAMLALDRGGSCDGMLFRIPAAKAFAELQLLWKREMATGAYEARWMAVRAGERPVRALTFVVNRAHERYIGGLPIEQVAHMICTGQGALGTNRAYFEDMLRSLAAMGVRDAGMERLRRAILARS